MSISPIEKRARSDYQAGINAEALFKLKKKWTIEGEAALLSLYTMYNQIAKSLLTISSITRANLT